jgi:hypothetical protein
VVGHWHDFAFSMEHWSMEFFGKKVVVVVVARETQIGGGFGGRGDWWSQGNHRR